MSSLIRIHPLLPGFSSLISPVTVFSARPYLVPKWPFCYCDARPVVGVLVHEINKIPYFQKPLLRSVRTAIKKRREREILGNYHRHLKKN